MRIADAAAIRDRGAEGQLVEIGSSTSRRDLLGALAVAPLAALSTAEMGHFGVPILGDLVPLRRTREGRHLSRIRYHNAESFFAPVEQGFPFRQNDQLYQIGITVQLVLSSHLLDVGFDDAWCAKNIGLFVNKSLAHANATGLGHDCSELKQLADSLSPYARLRNADVFGAASACPFSKEQICRVVRDLLERVREVTGHSRRRRWRGSAVNQAPKPPLDDGERDRATDIDQPSTEARERLEAAFAKLPPFTQSMFLAHRLDDLSYAEIATITGVSVRRVEREMARALVAIDRALSEQPRRSKWWR